MKKIIIAILIGLGLFFCEVSAQNNLRIQDTVLQKNRFQNTTLEMSLKPFKLNDKAYIRQVANEVFRQWSALIRQADTVSVMLWSSDGSEILDYKGNLNQPLEWGKYIGNPNSGRDVGSGPKELTIHERAYLYMENPPIYSYGDLKFIAQTLREVGQSITGKPILVGATFDPGPEFAKSDFKYKKHLEILGGNAMGKKSMVSCYSVLNADKESYAGFPNGIQANTPFGTFFGKQSQHFLTDLGFDFIWFSNGFGFGVEGWNAIGSIFNGKGFEQEKMDVATAKMSEFWKFFRKECPKFQIQTRGTNLSVGSDLARDAVDLKNIYKGNFNILPPPNSPWAALDGDFGLELVGYMSRMSELPHNRFPFRFYTHDPWWLNSPWLDRYGREPHDIYMPLSVCRIDANGNIGIPTHLNLLAINDSHGNMPVQVPNEVTPHILKARMDAPSAPGPLVWVYPFDEYHDWAHRFKDRLPEIYYGDWYIRQSINNGLPLNTVISTTSFQSVIVKNPDLFKYSILVAIAPEAGSTLEKALIQFVEKGGKLIVYGPVDHSSQTFTDFLNLKNESPLDGEMKISSYYMPDLLERTFPKVLNHRSLLSGGGICSNLKNRKDSNTKMLVQVEQSGTKRDIAWVRCKPEWQGGKVVYLRGTNSSNFLGGRLLTPDDPTKWFTGPLLSRYALHEFGFNFSVDKQNPAVKSPVLTISRSNNAFVFSGYNPSNTVKLRFKMPQGAPILFGLETKLENGNSTYTMPTAWNRECRVFVEQNSGIVSYKELYSGQLDISRRFQINGLKNATVRIYPEEKISDKQFHAYVNVYKKDEYPWLGGDIPFVKGNESLGNYYELKNVSGELVVAW